MKSNLLPLTQSLFGIVLATASAPAAVLIDRTFDGVANDIGPAFQQVTNGLGAGGSSNLTTGLITTGDTSGATPANSGNSAYGFNNATTVDLTALDPAATGFTATFEVSSVGADVSTLWYNGLFFGFVSGTDATGTEGPSLWNNNPNAFGYVAGSGDLNQGGYGDHLMRQDGNTDTYSTNTALTTTQPTDASFADGFTVSISVFNDNTWSVSSTGLSTDLNDTGSLNTLAFSYADIVDDLGLFVSIQGEHAATLDVDRITLTSIPEPTSLALLGLSGLLCFARRRR